MNILKGKIESVEENGSLSFVKINVDNFIFSSIIIENTDTASYLKKGNSVNVIFKETEVVIGKGATHFISLQNKLIGNILEIKIGKLLSKLHINTSVGKITAIITSDAVSQLQLQIGEEIMVMIKSNEIMLSV